MKTGPQVPPAVVQARCYRLAEINAALRLCEARIPALPGILPPAFEAEPGQ
jgi:hypothetical protein